jgi:hypothetical protein
VRDYTRQSKLVLASTFLFSAIRAQAAGLVFYVNGRFIWGKGVVFIFEGSDLQNKDVNGANIFTGSDYNKLSCSLNKEEGRIVCVSPGLLAQFAGPTGIVYLAGHWCLSQLSEIASGQLLRMFVNRSFRGGITQRPS